MITSAQAKYLIELPKKLVEDDILLDNKVVSAREPFQERFYLMSETDDEFSFFIQVKQSAKRAVKVSLHCQEDNAEYGILRIDYNGRHKNPEIANEHVPASFRPFTAQWLDQYSGHIHYVVDGYRPLAWAIPLELDVFPVKKVDAFSDISTAFTEFCKTVNVQTAITMQENLF